MEILIIFIIGCEGTLTKPKQKTGGWITKKGLYSFPVLFSYVK